MMPSPGTAPRWFSIVVLIVMLPVFQIPMLLDSCPPDHPGRTLVWIYPFYVLVAGWLAWQCYPQRRTMAWVLLALMALSHVAIYILVTSPTEHFI